MIIRDSSVDIFDTPKNISLNGKSYTIKFGVPNSQFRTVIVNGEYSDTRIYEIDIKNMTSKFKDELRMAINQYETTLKRQKEYLNWDGKLD